jgi:hypothetical protein
MNFIYTVDGVYKLIDKDNKDNKVIKHATHTDPYHKPNPNDKITEDFLNFSKLDFSELHNKQVANLFLPNRLQLKY